MVLLRARPLVVVALVLALAPGVALPFVHGSRLAPREPLRTLGMRFGVRQHMNEAPDGVAISPDGKVVVSIGREYVSVYYEDGGERSTSRRHGALGPRTGAFLPDGRFLLLEALDRVRIVDPAQRDAWSALAGRDASVRRGEPEARLAISRDGHTIASLTAPGALVVRDADSGSELARRALDGDALASGSLRVGLSPDGRTVAFHLGSGPLRFLSLATGAERTVPVAEDFIPALALGTKEAFAALGPSVAAFDPARGIRVRSRRLEAEISTLALSSDERTLAAGLTSGTVLLLDADTLAERGRLMGERHGIVGLAFDARGEKLASACDRAHVRRWDLADPSSGEGHDMAVDYLAFSHDGRRLASAETFGGSVCLWDPASGRLVRRVTVGASPASTRALAFSDDGSLVTAIRFPKGAPALRWLVPDDAPAQSVPCALPRGFPDQHLVLSGDGRMVAIGDCPMAIGSVATGRTLSISCSEVLALEPRATGGALMATHESGWVGVVDVASQMRLATIDVPASCALHVALSRAGDRIAVAVFESNEKCGVSLHHLPSGRRLAWVQGGSKSAFSPDGRLLAVVGFPGAGGTPVRFLETASGGVLDSFLAPSGITSVAFSPDGRTLATGHPDGAARLWEAP